MPFKILAIGDVHGREVLSRIQPSDFDKIVFIGDYVDTHDKDDLSNSMILDNLKNIIHFKKQYPDKVVLLLGNHDIHYMYHEEVGIFSGFRPQMLEDLQAIYLKNSDLFQMAYQYQTTLFTHAGISNKWYRSYNGRIHTEIRIIKEQKGINRIFSLSEKLNCLLFSEAGRRILFSPSGLRMCPEDKNKVGGIIWADKQETETDYLKSYHQVVGHTPVNSLETQIDPYDDSCSITYIDNEDKEFFELSL